MKGSDAVSAIRPALAMLRARAEVSPTEALAMLSFALGLDVRLSVRGEKSKARSEAGRQGGLKSAARRAGLGETEIARRQRARALLNLALKRGDVTKEPCHCGSLDVEAHHSDYDNPLIVAWLCRKHHRATHSAGLQPNASNGFNQTQATASTKAEQLPPLGFPLASPSGSPDSDPKESAVASEGSDRFSAEKAQPEATAAAPRDWSKRPPTNLDEAREMPLEERARHAVTLQPHQLQWIEPSQWPEVRMAVVAYRAAVQKPNLRVGQYASDAGIRRLVELFAAGLTADEVCTAIPLVVASSWWTSGDTARDLGSITLTVIRRATPERPAGADLSALPRTMFGGAT